MDTIACRAGKVCSSEWTIRLCWHCHGKGRHTAPPKGLRSRIGGLRRSRFCPLAPKFEARRERVAGIKGEFRRPRYPGAPPHMSRDAACWRIEPNYGNRFGDLDQSLFDDNGRAPIVPYPHMPRNPLALMNRTPRSASRRVVGIRTAPAAWPRGSFMRNSRISFRCCSAHCRRLDIESPGLSGAPSRTTRGRHAFRVRFDGADGSWCRHMRTTADKSLCAPEMYA